MITDIIKPASTTTKRCNLLLHCGSHAVSRSELAHAPTPPSSSTWQPIPHISLLQVVEHALTDHGFTIAGQAHGLTHDCARYFGLIEVSGFAHHRDYHYVVGVRNSHDMRFSAGLVAGSQVLVCDNLSFSGEVQLARKHTPRILHDLPTLITSAVSRLKGYWTQHTYRVIRYQQAQLTDQQAHHLVIKAVDKGIMPNSTIPKVLANWRTPAHEEFTPRTIWSLQNAFTEVFKGRLEVLPSRTQKLHFLLDSEAGLN